MVRAAVLYVLRCLVDEDIPLNDGCLLPVRIVAPRGCLLHPEPPAAVAAGNVETSQAIVNAPVRGIRYPGVRAGHHEQSLLRQRALPVLRNAGRRRRRRAGLPRRRGRAYAHDQLASDGRGDPGATFPVRVERLAVRRGSGGDGRYRGGDGMVRALRFLEPMQVAILSGHRRVAPRGLHGGGSGLPGRNTLVSDDGKRVPLGGTAQLTVQAGDCIVIETPGGGGYGKAPDPPIT